MKWVDMEGRRRRKEIQTKEKEEEYGNKKII